MNEELLKRRFIFYKNEDNFKREAEQWLLQNNKDAIVFIEDTKTIWAQGVRFNADAVKNYVDNIYTDTKADIEDVTDQLNNIKEGLEEEIAKYNNDLDATNESLAEARGIIDDILNGNIDVPSSASTTLYGLINKVDDLEDEVQGLVTYKEKLDALDGKFEEYVKYDDLTNQSSTVFDRFIDIISGIYSQELSNFDIQGQIDSRIAQRWQILENGLTALQRNVENTYYKGADFTSQKIWDALISDPKGGFAQWQAGVQQGNKDN